MIREHLNPPNQNNKQILEKTNKNFARVDIFQFFSASQSRELALNHRPQWTTSRNLPEG